MASVRYYIEKRRDQQGRIRTQKVPILMYFSFDGKRLQLNTGERVNAGDWDEEKQVLKPGVPGSKQINRYLASLGEEVLSVYREARETGKKPGTHYMREQLKYQRRKDHIGFFDVFMRFIDENHSRWSIYTFRKIRTTYNHLRRFSEAEQIDIEFNRIDRDFLDRYVRFFRIKYNHSNNTIVKNLNVLKWFLNWATERGYNKSVLYRDYELTWETGPRVRTADLVLDWEELMRISHYEPGSRSLKEVRDIFCFMCFSGIKLSRVYQLKQSNVLGDQVRMPGKGGMDYYHLPLNERASQILAEYRDRNYPGDACFPHYSNPYFNQLLKQLGKEAGVNHFISLEIHAGPERGIRQVPKYQILSSKIAVNTFLFNGLRLGVSAETLAFVTDSKTLAAIERFHPLLEQAAFEDIRKFNRLPA